MMNIVHQSKANILVIHRDSVCAGDDCDAPHEIQFAVGDGESLESVIHRLIASSYLPSISGGKATWILESGKTPLAVVAQQWTVAQLLVQSENIWSILDNNAECHLYLNYWCQVDPNVVLERLRHGLPLPDKYSGTTAT